MASLHLDERTGNWIVMFRWGGRQYRRSCQSQNETAAQGTVARVRETIRLLTLGHINIPDDADPATWIMSDRQLKTKPKAQANKLSRLGEICDAYLADQLGKADTTIDAEKRHIGHLKEVLKAGTKLVEITLNDIQQYVAIRTKQTFHGKTVSGKTIRKELVTFRQVWSWARIRKVVKADCPIYNEARKWAVSIPKPTEKEKFQTWKQIETRIARGGLSPARAKELWESLFLEESQVQELLSHVKNHALHDFIYPMFAFAAYTGARRGEIRRSEIEDFRFDEGLLMIRERKRRKSMAQTFRFVPLHSQLAEVMREWLTKHPGGQYSIAPPQNMAKRAPKVSFAPMGLYEMHHHFKFTLKDSKWKVLRGFHVLRHSFGSNLARSGKVPRDTIAKWMGHTTEEMKDHYQHLFPQDGQSQIEVLK